MQSGYRGRLGRGVLDPSEESWLKLQTVKSPWKFLVRERRNAMSLLFSKMEKSRKVLEGPVRKWTVRGESRRGSLTGGFVGEPQDLGACSILDVNDRH